MLSIDIKARGRETKYEYIYRCIKAQILEGSLLAGEKLISKRNLAKALKVSVVTVESAYNQLAAEGFIYAKEKSGYYINKVMQGEVYTRAKQRQNYPKEKPAKKYFADFSGRLAQLAAFPSTVWARLMRETLNREDVLHPVGFRGAYELRAAISELLEKMRGMNIAPQNIIIGAGTENLYNLIIQLLGRERTFAVEDPGYSTIAKIYKANDVSYKYIPVDEEGAVIKGLEADVLHISPAHHFPTGRVMSASRRAEALLWVREKKRYIIEDEYDSEFRLRGMPVWPLQNADPSRIIYVNTFAKSISPTLRISYMVLPDELMELYEKKLGFYSCAVPVFEQYTLARFIHEGYFDKNISRIRTRSATIRSELIRSIKTLRLEAKIIEEDAGQHFMLKLNTEKSDSEIARQLEKQGIRLRFLSDYTHLPTEEDMHIAIINYSSVSLECIYKSINALLDAVKQ